MAIQKTFSVSSVVSAEFPCNAGRPPHVGFGAQRADGSLTNVGLSFYGSGISEGAKTNTFANLQNACLGQQNAEELAHVLSCSPAAGIVQLCPDLYRCGTARFADGVSLGAGHHGDVTAHLSVFSHELGEPIMACYADNLQAALTKAAEDFPVPDAELPPCTRAETNGHAQPCKSSAGTKASLAAVALCVLLLRS